MRKLFISMNPKHADNIFIRCKTVRVSQNEMQRKIETDILHSRKIIAMNDSKM